MWCSMILSLSVSVSLSRWLSINIKLEAFDVYMYTLECLYIRCCVCLYKWRPLLVYNFGWSSVQLEQNNSNNNREKKAARVDGTMNRLRPPRNGCNVSITERHEHLYEQQPLEQKWPQNVCDVCVCVPHHSITLWLVNVEQIYLSI